MPVVLSRAVPTRASGAEGLRRAGPGARLASAAVPPRLSPAMLWILKCAGAGRRFPSLPSLQLPERQRRGCR